MPTFSDEFKVEGDQVLRRVIYTQGKYRGTEGGWVSSTAKIDDGVYVAPDAMILDKAHVKDTVQVLGNAVIRGHAKVSGRVIVKDRAIVSGYADVSGNVVIGDDAIVHRSAKMDRFVQVYGQAQVEAGDFTDYVQICGNVRIVTKFYGSGELFIGGGLVITTDFLNRLDPLNRSRFLYDMALSDVDEEIIRRDVTVNMTSAQKTAYRKSKRVISVQEQWKTWSSQKNDLSPTENYIKGLAYLADIFGYSNLVVSDGGHYWTAVSLVDDSDIFSALPDKGKRILKMGWEISETNMDEDNGLVTTLTFGGYDKRRYRD